jgi:hypothetical protein
MSMQVENGQHADSPIICMEIHAKGKVPEQRTVHLVSHARELSGIVYDATDHMVKFVKKPRS